METARIPANRMKVMVERRGDVFKGTKGQGLGVKFRIFRFEYGGYCKRNVRNPDRYIDISKTKIII